MRRLGALLILAGVVVAVLMPSARAAMLTHAGGMLVASDPLPAQVDALVMTPESGEAGVIDIGDLYREFKPPTVVILEPDAREPETELARRGVKVPDIPLEVLRQLGVPREVVVKVSGGEGGTTENTAALATWARTRRPSHAVVVVSPTHGRRYRRALNRVWPADVPRASVRTARYSSFREIDWWQSRVTLRDGLFELQKLLLDYALHPL